MTTTFEHEGTLIHGTMREEDLIPAFESFIQTHYPERWDDTEFQTPRAWYRHGIYAENNHTEWCHYLFDVLDDLAPEGYYFGSHEGDGCDYGYWKIPIEGEGLYEE